MATTTGRKRKNDNLFFDRRIPRGYQVIALRGKGQVNEQVLKAPMDEMRLRNLENRIEVLISKMESLERVLNQIMYPTQERFNGPCNYIV